MHWLRGETAIEDARAEDVRTDLLLAGLNGWEEHDLDGGVQFVMYCADEDGRQRVEARLGTLRWTAVDDEDWAHAWKRFWKPARIGRRIVIKPTWETYAAAPDDLVIELDPGMAFGTGTHETTRMCVQWLEDVVGGGERVLDVGTGSGILSVAALRLGASQVVAVDNDPIAVRTAGENLAHNGVEATVVLSDATAALSGQAPFDVVVSNIVANAIIGLVDEARQHLRPAGRWIASGIILERVDDVRAVLAAGGFGEQQWRTAGEWASVCAVAPAARPR